MASHPKYHIHTGGVLCADGRADHQHWPNFCSHPFQSSEIRPNIIWCVRPCEMTVSFNYLRFFGKLLSFSSSFQELQCISCCLRRCSPFFELLRNPFRLKHIEFHLNCVLESLTKFPTLNRRFFIHFVFAIKNLSISSCSPTKALQSSPLLRFGSLHWITYKILAEFYGRNRMRTFKSSRKILSAEILAPVPSSRLFSSFQIEMIPADSLDCFRSIIFNDLCMPNIVEWFKWTHSAHYVQLVFSETTFVIIEMSRLVFQMRL